MAKATGNATGVAVVNEERSETFASAELVPKTARTCHAYTLVPASPLTTVEVAVPTDVQVVHGVLRPTTRQYS